MSLKLVFVILAFIAYQGVSASPMPEASADGIVEQIKEALEKLRAIVEQALNEAEAALKNALEELKEAAQGIIGEGIGKVLEAIINAKNEIEQMVEEAAQVGADVSECIKDANADLDAISERVSEQLKECVSASIENASKIVSDSVDALKAKVGELITELGNKVAACGEAENKLKCLKEALQEVGQQAIELPKFIAAEVAKIYEALNGVRNELVACSSNSLANAVAEAAQVVESVRQCIQEKLPSKSE